MINFEELANAVNPNPGQTLKATPTAPAYTIPAKLLSKGNTNAKTSKNSLETFILYMSPAAQNSKGADLCPFRSKGCTAACLYTAGRGKFNNVQRARMNKSEYFIRDKKTFLAQLALELKAINKRQLKKGTKAAIRLNGTTDVDFLYLLKNRVGLDALQLEGLVFYDYTKDPHRVKRYAASSYTLTFSRAEDNEPQALEILQNGGIVSAVFADRLPELYKGYKVIDGDASDDLMLTAQKKTKPGAGLILGLKAKGDAKKDASGFVITSHLKAGGNAQPV